MEVSMFRVRADIDLSAMRKNVKAIKKGLRKGTKTCCVIKADAYGHGAVQAADALSDLADFFAVATMPEALELRGHGVTHPILILGFVHPGYYEEAVKHDIRLAIFDWESARKLSACACSLNKTAKIHIKLDTGMSRIGLAPTKESLAIIQKMKALPGIEIEGIFTHLFAADERSKASAMKQIMQFGEFYNDLNHAGIQIPIRHCSNSAAAINLNLANFDMVRLGIAMYGLYPSRYVRQIELHPSMSLISHVVMVKTIKKGTTVSYGATWTAPEDSVIATIPVGYADGYVRLLSNQGYVLIHGKKAPIVGRVCMDQFMVDVTKISKVKVFDEVVLVGSQKDKTITMEELAQMCETINYEFACGISKRVPRRYLLKGKVVSVKEC